jgi:ABC-type branched-subunit amino acid transport system substrate-binding protein
MTAAARRAATAALIVLAAGCGSGADGSPQGKDGASGPGVTESKILLGIDVQVGSDEQAEAAGVEGASVGDMREQMQALVDDLNSRGGISGRSVEPVFAEYRGATSAEQEAEEQSACAKYTQDQEVFAVISPRNGGTAVLRDCLQKAGVPLVSYAPVDDPTHERLTTYFSPGTLSLDRAARAQVGGLAALQFLTPASRVGVLHAAGGGYPEVLERSMLPALREASVGSVTQAQVRTDDTSTISSDVSAAVLAFNSAKVDRVVTLGVGGLPVGLFMVNAETQKYRPDYGLSSYDYAEALRQNVPPVQLEGMQGIGWQTEDATTPPPLTEPQQRCTDLMGDAGLTAADANGRAVLYQDCDLVWYFEAAASRAGEQLTLATFTAGGQALGDSLDSTLAYRLDFGAGRRDGVAAVRPFKYDPGCKCIVAFGAVEQLPPTAG